MDPSLWDVQYMIPILTHSDLNLILRHLHCDRNCIAFKIVRLDYLASRARRVW